MHTSKTIRLVALGAAFAALLPLALASAQSRPPNLTNRLHMYSKPAVVRIISGFTGQWVWDNRRWNTQSISSGSGFLINPDGYVLTNAHVVSDIREGDNAGRRTLLFQLAVQVLRARNIAVTRENVSNAMNVLGQQASLSNFQRINRVFLQSGTSFPYEIKSYGAPTGEGQDLPAGKDVAVLKIEIKNAPTLPLGNSTQMQVGDRIFLLGYPGAADSDVLDSRSALEPTTNDGSITAKKNSADGAPILQTNTAATHGNSGGPAINEKGEVIGLLTFRGNTVNGQEIQGFNFIVPTSTVMEFVRQSGTENKASPIDVKWREGLDNFWNQRYKYARDDFQEVLALYGDHSEAKKLISEAQEFIATGQDRSSSWVWMAVIVVLGGGFLLVAGGGLLAFVLIRRKKGKAQAPAMPVPAYAGAAQPAPAPQRSAQPEIAPAPNFPRTAPLGGSPRTEMFEAAATGRLVCTMGPLEGQEFPVNQGVYLGRDATRSQVVIADAQVSGQHLWIGPVGSRIVARDNGSTNGTFLNNDLAQRITEVELNDRDVLILGGRASVKFVFLR
ncbi:MAG: trypsin-like peptidase domain-containing protein [Acidobacteria bacterium]|nr:trypsin-like peptidase domain-containing protein [Acidobacteriota bacterium]